METDFTKILLDFKAIPRHKRPKTFMEINGYPHYENVCSNILMFYLDPYNDHGLKDLVLNSLMQLIDINFKFDTDFEAIEIYRESKTIADNRLDLLILTENYAIGIENKIFHHLHNDLSDYNKTVLSYCYNSRRPICIVLSLNKLTSKEDIEKIQSNNFVNITYEQFFDNLKNNIGRHLTNSNIIYLNHLTDFIISIENITPKTMENKVLYTFFKNNAESIQELTDSFTDYRNSLYQKIYHLKETIPPDVFAPSVDKQWIYDGRCLVHDYTIDSKYKVSVDIYIDIYGWEIQLFARNGQSTDFLFNIMCKDQDFLPKPLDTYEKGERLIYEKFETDSNISTIAKTLTDLLARIEYFKKQTDKNCDLQHGISALNQGL